MVPPQNDRPVVSSDRLAVSLLCEAVPGVQAIYRFGSSVTGSTRPDSDIDLAVLVDRALDPRNRFDLQERLAARLGRSVDLVDLRRASTVLASQVITTGQLLYEGDGTSRGAFEDYVYGAYARLNEERRAILDRVADEGTVYGR